MKYKNLIPPLVLLLTIMLCTGCSKDWLEKKPVKTLAIPETLEDCQALLNNSLLNNSNIIAFGEIASDGHYISEAVWSASTSPNANNAYSWSQIIPYTTFPAWSNIYARLYYINTVLDVLKEIDVTSLSEEQQKNHIHAQALFLKAETYYWLAQQYAQPYDPVTALTDQGIPIQENSDHTQQIKRVTVQKTYDLILGCLNEAVSSLPVTPKFPTQASLPAAHALLARTYMSILDYDKAWDHADKALALNNTLINYNDLSASANFVGLFNAEVLFHDLFSTTQLSNFITSGCLIDQALYDSYDAYDLRKVIFFKKIGNLITFKGNYNNSATVLFCGIATDELYLMRAECYARKNNTAAAMMDLNDLLRTRWKNINGVTTYIDQVSANADEALVKILMERKKELILRGLRWGDLRRLNQEERFKVTLTRTIGGKTYTLEPNSYKYTFPMLQNIMEISRIPQTTGW